MAVLNSNGIVLRAVTANKFISQTVVAVRCKIRCEKLISELLVEQVALNDSVLIRRTGRIHTHLEILVIHGNLMEGKFQIGKNAELTGAVAVFFDPHIPDFHRVVHGYRHFLGGKDVAIIAFIDGIGHAVAAGILRLIKGLANRLPGDAPVIPALVISQIYIVSRPVHGNSVWTELGDPVVLR